MKHNKKKPEIIIPKKNNLQVKNIYPKLSNIITNTETGQKYKKGQMIGRGGYACCLKVVDMESQETYACKVSLKNPKTNNLKEAINHRSLNHKNIVKYYGHFSDDDFVYIIMELCDSDINRFYETKGIDKNIILSHIHQIADACHYLHTEKHIVHGDLKPENILIKDGIIKIADFGLSEQLSSKNKKGYWKPGTLQYNAPEILRGKLCGVEIDCWALGCILCQLLTGKITFYSADIEFMKHNILELIHQNQ
ncbi:PLK1 [Cordylochernes scorpioides]|uniref:PLK1 n=1 Tax=Cordylochernes scorpioides TaxID=51811 RepID=A0ABY6KJB4_9ARAC|nr:PLK1 [Cordylochernes scorpioides]